MTHLPKIARRLAAVLILAGVLFAVHVSFIQPIIEAFERSAREVGRLEDQLARLAGMAGSLDASVARRMALAQRLDGEEFHYKDGSAGIAAARLQQAVSELVRANGGEMRMARVVEGTGDRDREKIMMSFSFAIASQGLPPLLHGIEGMRPVAFVDGLAIRLNHQIEAMGRGGEAAHGQGPYRDQPILDVSLDVSAHSARRGQ